MGHLKHLKTVLDNKTLIWVFTFIGIGFFYNLAIYERILQILLIMILLFIPYLVFVLHQYGKRNWITGLCIWMGISLAPWLLLDRSDPINSLIYFSVPMIFFLLYCWFLNQHIIDWLASYSHQEIR
jgi:hypothetical protein